MRKKSMSMTSRQPLTLNRETVRTLDHEALAAVHSGEDLAKPPPVLTVLLRFSRLYSNCPQCEKVNG